MITFKERVKDTCIAYAKDYNKNYVTYEYLICSKAFSTGYHLIKSDKGNYLHLTGVHTTLSPEDFFNKCYDGSLQESDFDFIKPGKDEKSVKGSVRDKIKALPGMVDMFGKELYAEDNFKKNKVRCAFATSDNTCTLGFIKQGRPQSLLKGNNLDQAKMQKVDLIFKRIRGSKTVFSNLVYGDAALISEYKNEIKDLISKDFLK